MPPTFQFLNSINYRFLEKTYKNSSLFLLKANDAIDLINECKKSDLPILGIDGFVPVENGIQIEQNYGTSFCNVSGEEPSGNWEKAVSFIKNIEDKTIWFEIVYDCNNVYRRNKTSLYFDSFRRKYKVKIVRIDFIEGEKSSRKVLFELNNQQFWAYSWSSNFREDELVDVYFSFQEEPMEVFNFWNNNHAKKKGIYPTSNEHFSYDCYGQIQSLHPTIIDTNIIELPFGDWIDDDQKNGSWVYFKMSKLIINPIPDVYNIGFTRSEAVLIDAILHEKSVLLSVKDSDHSRDIMHNIATQQSSTVHVPLKCKEIVSITELFSNSCKSIGADKMYDLTGYTWEEAMGVQKNLNEIAKQIQTKS